MYVDKKLTGVNAVQTLARLNRSMTGKPQPFVLDFRNDAEAITEAFRPWFDTTVVEPGRPQPALPPPGHAGIRGRVRPHDVEHYWEVFASVAGNARKGNGALYAALAGPRQRFIDDLDDDEQAAFRSDLEAPSDAFPLPDRGVDRHRSREALRVRQSLLLTFPFRSRPRRAQPRLRVELTHLRIEQSGTRRWLHRHNDTDPLTRSPGRRP